MTQLSSDIAPRQVSYLTPSLAHAPVVVRGLADGPAWGVVTDQDLLSTAVGAADRLAGSCASGELVTVTPDEHVEAAADLVRRCAVSHLMVVDPERNQPLGVISTLDLARIVAWGRA